MVKRIELFERPTERFANPTPLGLLGLGVACASLVPIAFGYALTPAAFKTAAAWALLFGGGCQFLCGMMNFANKNVFGGTVFTAFSFSWAYNAWAFNSLAEGFVPDHEVGLVVDVALLVVFAVLTYGFGFFAKLLFFFLLDIDVIYLCRIVNALTHSRMLALPLAAATVILGAIGLWLAFGGLINPLAGRPIFGVGTPMFDMPKKAGFDWTLRRTIFESLYAQWRRAAFREMAEPDLRSAVAAGAPGRDLARELAPELFYLAEFGYVKLVTPADDPHRVVGARLTSSGIDLYEQMVLNKYAAAATPTH